MLKQLTKMPCNKMSNSVAGAARGIVGASDAGALYARGGGRKYLNRAERQRVLATMMELEPGRALFALTLAWTGARVSEVLALTPSSFQIERGIVALQTLKRRRHSVREVPVPPALIAALDRHFGIALAQRNEEASGRRLFPWSRTTAWRTIKSVMRRCGLAGRHATPRGLRHAFGIGALQAGVPLNIAQRWLGHSRINTTAIYAAACGPEETGFAERFWRLDDDRGEVG